MPLSTKAMCDKQYEELMAAIVLVQQNNGTASSMQIPVDDIYSKE